MEEDIKIVEEIKDNYERHSNNPKLKDIAKRKQQALETLLKRYKELEEENKELKAITNLYNSYEVEDEKQRILIADTRYFEDGYFKYNFIPISLIENKIDECEKEDKENIELGLDVPHWICVGKIGVLNQLLSERSPNNDPDF